MAIDLFKILLQGKIILKSLPIRNPSLAELKPSREVDSSFESWQPLLFPPPFLSPPADFSSSCACWFLVQLEVLQVSICWKYHPGEATRGRLDITWWRCLMQDLGSVATIFASGSFPKLTWWLGHSSGPGRKSRDTTYLMLENRATLPLSCFVQLEKQPEPLTSPWGSPHPSYSLSYIVTAWAPGANFSPL